GQALDGTCVCEKNAPRCPVQVCVYRAYIKYLMNHFYVEVFGTGWLTLLLYIALGNTIGVRARSAIRSDC
ncbi:MAG: hypothetical protein ACK53Y_18750, partial [bacterium]